MDDLSKRIASLSPEKRELLKLHLAKKEHIVPKEKHQIKQRMTGQRVPLSYSQKRLWFLDALKPGNPANNRLAALSMHGNLNIAALQNSISSIIDRHEILRTSFQQHDNQPFQFIREQLDIDLPIIDRHALPETEWQQETQKIAREEINKPFDLARDPIIRTRLIRFSAQQHILLLCMHHIGIDAWSMHRFKHELSVLYESHCSGQPSPLAKLSIQYGDYAVWQRQFLTREMLKSQLSYWKKQLNNMSLLQLPTDRPRPSVQTFTGATVNRWIPDRTTRALKSLAQSEGVTLFMTLLAAFQILMHRYTQQDDIVVGSPIAGRTQSQTTDLMGFFINSLVLRTHVSGNSDFRTLLTRVRKVCLEAYSNQHIPFEKIVEELQPARDLSRNPLFQVMFNFENIPTTASAFRSLDVKELDVDCGIAPLDLTVEMIEKDSGLFCQFNYNTALFNASTIKRMAGHFEILLESIASNPKQHISYFPLLSEAERHQLEIDESVTMHVVSDRYRATPVQERFWLMHEMNPESPLCNESVTFRLTGYLDREHLHTALNRLVARHESLRMQLKQVGGVLEAQIVQQDVPCPLEYIEMKEASDSEVAECLDREAIVRFDVTQAPLIRAMLVRVNAELNIVQLTAHHAVIDGWSLFHVLPGELWTNYLAGCDGHSPTPSAPELSYVEFARLADEAKHSPDGEQDLCYFRHLLEDSSQALNLPANRQYPPRPSMRGIQAKRRLKTDVRERISGVATDLGVRPFDVTCAAFVAQLMRYSGELDLIIASPVGNRNRFPGAEDLIGCCLDNLLLRLRFDSQPSFASIARLIYQQRHETYNHRSLSFGTLIESLADKRDTTRNPLYQVIFNYMNFSVADVGYARLDIDASRRGTGTTMLDLSLHVTEEKGGYLLTLEGNADIFDPDYLKCMLTHFVALLGHGLESPQTELGTLRLLDEAEKYLLLDDWNDTQTDYPSDQCIHQLFEAQAERTPDAVAVVFEDSELTYRELNARANQLAHYLRDEGVQSGDLVAIAMDRSINMIVGLLSILKTGGAYVPLDSDYPQSRLSFMLQDTNAKVLLTTCQLSGQFKTQNCKVICIETEWHAISKASKSNLSHSGNSQDIAYVIYTSGSTGTPKGVMVPHQGIARLLFGINYVDLGSDKVILHMASISFDASTFEVWGSLLHGGKCVLFPEDIPTALEIKKAIGEHGVTTAWLTSALFNSVVDEDPYALAGLHQLLIGGEALSVSHVRKAMELLPSTQIINGYGPTESTTFTCCYQIPDHLNDGMLSVPIGKPIANTQVYILDHGGLVCPAGVTGELHIGGAGLARGYLNNPELTAEKFIPNPFSDDEGSRLYKTGDLVRYLPDGNIEFIGRIDHQVKIRGFRIELGEIEACLLKHDAVSQAVVIALEDDSGDKRLVAYLISSAVEPPETTELQALLKQSLPDYMIPAAFVWMEAYPVTANGKIDRKALPKPEITDDSAGESPRTETEQVLAGLWQELLSVDVITINADFFQLGGHSLLLTRLASRIRDTFGLDISLQSMFEHATLEQQARLVDQSEPLLALPPITHVCERDSLELSFAQQRLWFLDKLEGEPNTTYNIAFSKHLCGDVDVDALRSALCYLVGRHDSLRMVFRMQDGELRIHLLDPYDPLTITRPEEKDGENREQKIAELLNQHASMLFNLSEGPLFHMELVQLGEDDHLLLGVIHHIISDGWSQGILGKELSGAYEAYHADHAPDMPALPIQYQDYAHWQRQWLSGDVLDAQLEYWQSHLAGAPALLELPTDFPRPVQQNYRGGLVSFTLSASLTAQFKALVRKHSATLFMGLLTAFNLLLNRYSRQDDIVVGAPIANRTHSQIEGIIGFFVNTLALRTNIRPDDSFTALLSRVKEASLNAYAHQDIPFELLVQELQPERSLSYSPLFQVMFAFQNAPMHELSLSGLDTEPVAHAHDVAKFDLTLNMEEISGELHGCFEYASALFESATIERMAKHFEVLLESIVTDPEQVVVSYAILTQDEEHQLLVDWNATQADYPTDQCVHQLFEAQAERTPDAVAVVFEGSELTYRELNVRANQLAHHLASMGVEPDDLVGICVERSLEMMIGLLGILKAGGAYVSLDPAYPKERLAFMLEDGRVAVLLTQKSLANELPEHKAQTICIDSLWQDIVAAGDTNNPGSAVMPNHLAYVIYTSGSTGKPKGVMIEHRSAVNLLHSLKDRPGLDASDVLLAVSTISFDIHLLELFLPLSVGAKVIIASHDVAMDGLRLKALLIESGATIMQATPITWRMLLYAGWNERLSLKVLSTGEALPRELANELLVRCSMLWDLYGPTETTVYASIEEVKNTESNISFGRPIDNVQFYITDQAARPLPAGIPGELMIGGAGLARGYLNRSDLTEQQFITDTLSGNPDARLYRTGDLARYLPGGRVEILGRIDHQVKIRGFRIELGEIEACLLKHDAVSQAVAIALEDDSGDKRLVAYLISSAVTPPGTTALQVLLKQYLPDYMIPSAFVWMEAYPVTANGKIDRKALPKPEITDDSAGESPRTETEQVLAGLWLELLPVDAITTEANFFYLGGHSLLLTRLVSRIRDIFGQELSLQSMFAHPILKEQAHLIDQSRHIVELPPIECVSEQDGLELSFAQQRLWFLDEFECEANATYNIPFSQRLRGIVDANALRSALCYLVKRHNSLRMVFRMEDGVAHVHMLDSYDPLTITDLSDQDKQDREQKAKALVRKHASTRFNLSEGPLFQMQLIELEDNDHLLLGVIHHIISDGWSQGILNKELSEAYGAYLDGHEPDMAPLPVQYQDYAHWQRQWLSGTVLQEQLEYWQSHLAGAPSLLELPTDFPRPLEQSFIGRLVSFTLSEAITAQLKQLTQEHGATLFMSLLAAFNLLLSRYSRQEDIVVGTPIANRIHSQIEGLIGFFVNTLALRTNIRPDESFTELLSRVKEASLNAYSHQDIPFELLVQELQTERSLSHSPLFQVMFAFQNAPMDGLNLSGLVAAPVVHPHETAKFDLTLSMEEVSGELHGCFEYASALFEQSTIERMAQHFEVLLGGIVANPEQPVSDLPLLQESERQQLIVDWNNTQADFPSDQCIHHLFEAQAKRTPDAVAVVFEDSELTYRELNERSNQLAHYLVSQGVVPDQLVGICVERSLAMMVGLLGILKACGAYVLLDSAYPKDRLSFMLEDANIAVLLTQQSLVDALPEHDALTIYLDTQWGDIAKESLEPSCITATPDQLAYVIYTSGSTGKPKGVMIEHCSAANLLYSLQERPGIDASDVLVAVTTISFDIHLLELFLPLTVGAKVVIASRDIVVDGRGLYQLLIKCGATIMQATPVSWHMLLQSGWDEPLSLKALSTGEALSHELANKLFPMCSSLWNLYGPTEATVYASIEKITAPKTKITFGSPIDNTLFYIVDNTGHPLPVGIPGELLIGGAGLARGYINRPDLTEQQFITDTISGNPDARLYRTGDLARYLADGHVEILGRIDHQVKIRGFRIELGEIESCLMQHDLVEESVVIACEDNPGDKQLAAYVVLSDDAGDDWIEVLRNYLKGLLPQYMIPVHFTRLEKLPITPNGKVDRKALPAPNFSDASCRHLHARPLGMLEKKIAAIWLDILGVEPLSIDDNFFDLGGNSLSLIMLCERLKKQFSQPFVMSLVYAEPTLKALAGIVRSRDVTVEGNESQRNINGAPVKGLEGLNHAFFTVRESGQKTPLFWMCGGRMLELIKDHIDDRPAYVFDYLGNSEHVKYKTIPEIITCYLYELKKVKPHGPYMLGGYSLGGLLALELANQLHKAGDEVKMLFLLSPTSLRNQTKGSIHATGNLQKIKNMWLRHQRKLSDMNYSERRNYILHIIEKRSKNFWFPLLRKTGLIGLLPQKTRWDYLIGYQNNRSISEYNPGTYSGDMTIVAERKQISQVETYWKPLGMGNTTIIELDCSHLGFWKIQEIEEEWTHHLMDSLESCE